MRNEEQLAIEMLIKLVKEHGGRLNVNALQETKKSNKRNKEITLSWDATTGKTNCQAGEATLLKLFLSRGNLNATFDIKGHQFDTAIMEGLYNAESITYATIMIHKLLGISCNPRDSKLLSKQRYTCTINYLSEITPGLMEECSYNHLCDNVREAEEHAEEAGIDWMWIDVKDNYESI